ncbi:MAG: sodium:proton antiporter [Gammaproteobacteria bacterium]|nr:sodium:proton antiporter [Gammaproteobacteria bacterium]
MHSEIAQTVLLIMGLLLVALAAEPLARLIRLPYTALLVLLGFLISLIAQLAGYPIDSHSGEFHDLVFFVFLPVLIFESALSINTRLFFKNLATILILAIPIMLFSTAVTALLVYLGIDHPSGFPWQAALITGALLSATDPVAVVALLKQAKTPDRLGVLIEGESLLNDATAIVVFSLALSLALNPQQNFNAGHAFQQFSLVFFGGLLIGILVSFIALLMLRTTERPLLHALINVISAYFAFLLAEHVLHVSGVMSVLALGLIMGRAHRADYGENQFVEQLWEFNAYIANALVFLLMGLIISLDMFEERWLAILIGIGAVLVVRLLGMFLLIPLATSFTPEQPIDRRYQTILFWGGLRGAVTLALALSIPKQLDYWWTIQSIAFGVVVFTLFVQAPTMNIVLKRLGLANQ